MIKISRCLESAGHVFVNPTETCKFSAVTEAESGDMTTVTVYMRTFHLAHQ